MHSLHGEFAYVCVSFGPGRGRGSSFKDAVSISMCCLSRFTFRACFDVAFVSGCLMTSWQPREKLAAWQLFAFLFCPVAIRLPTPNEDRERFHVCEYLGKHSAFRVASGPGSMNADFSDLQ